MAMSRRLFRTNQAIESFEKCLKCESLPKNKEEEVQKELTKSRNRLQQQKDDVSTMHSSAPMFVSPITASDSSFDCVEMQNATINFKLSVTEILSIDEISSSYASYIY